MISSHCADVIVYCPSAHIKALFQQQAQVWANFLPLFQNLLIILIPPA